MTTAPSPCDASLWISDMRFRPYLSARSGDHARATALYEWDGELAGALLVVTRDVEVLLRNAVHQTMCSTRESNALQSWLLDADLLAAKEVERIVEAVGIVRRHGHVPDEDRVVATVTLGFWARLFGTRYEELWRNALRFAFPFGDGTRHQIAGFTNRIAQLRNRIAHHEPLFGQAIGDRHDDLLGLASTIDPRARRWIEERTRVPHLLAARP